MNPAPPVIMMLRTSGRGSEAVVSLRIWPLFTLDREVQHLHSFHPIKITSFDISIVQ